MAYLATVIPVMIASLGDVREERDIIRSVIHDWNDINASSSMVVLAPVGWETHSSPELGARPQALINSRVLKDCDLLVGVFWTRLGTPTGKAASGTVEEINEHLAAGKPAMIYFSSRPVAPESLDAEQYAEVSSFKEKCRELGLIETFDAAEFREKFRKQLQLCLANNAYLRVAIQSTRPQAGHGDEEGNNGTKRYRLSDEATTLLTAASSKDGVIMKLSYINGTLIAASNDSFGAIGGRAYAKWENALNELITSGLVVPRGHKGEMYELTHQGWELADTLLQRVARTEQVGTDDSNLPPSQ